LLDWNYSPFTGYKQHKTKPNREQLAVKMNVNYKITRDGLYKISGSFTKDASNILGVKANDKWNPMWSRGFGREIINQPFYSFKSFLLTLKLRKATKDGKSQVMNRQQQFHHLFIPTLRVLILTRN
jgi:hypothetical protein